MVDFNTANEKGQYLFLSGKEKGDRVVSLDKREIEEGTFQNAIRR